MLGLQEVKYCCQDATFYSPPQHVARPCCPSGSCECMAEAFGSPVVERRSAFGKAARLRRHTFPGVSSVYLRRDEQPRPVQRWVVGRGERRTGTRAYSGAAFPRCRRRTVNREPARWAQDRRRQSEERFQREETIIYRHTPVYDIGRSVSVGQETRPAQEWPPLRSSQDAASDHSRTRIAAFRTRMTSATAPSLSCSRTAI